MEVFPWICFPGECVSMDVSKDSVFPWTMCFVGSISMDMFPWRMSFHGRVSNDNMFPWTMCFPPYTWCRDMEMLYWSFVRGIPQWLMDSSHKGWVMCSFDVFFVYAWTTCWINSIVLGDSRFHDVCCNEIQNISDSMWTKFPYTANCMIYMYNKYKKLHFEIYIGTNLAQSGTKPNLVAKILATNFGVFLYARL